MKKNTKLTENFIVQKNTIWTSVDMTYFKVTKVTKKLGHIWIYYQHLNNPKANFFCYQDAFLQRFFKNENYYINN